MDLKKMDLKVLRLKIYQPHAHYRIPFTYQRRHTYPLPPYSTIIGFLCNVLGIRNFNNEGEPDDENYKKLKNIKVSICGRFDSKTTEYTWFRNLVEKSHNERFGYSENRYISGNIEHPGGQVPVLIDILNEMKLWIYFYHEDEGFLSKIKNSLKNPKDRIYPLHLGRAEDWIVIEEIKEDVGLIIDETGGNFDRFFWIPKEIYFKEEHKNKTKFEFEKIGGLLYRLPTFYHLQNGTRNFKYVDVKLNDGEIIFSKWNLKVYFDKDERIPIFFVNL